MSIFIQGILEKFIDMTRNKGIKPTEDHEDRKHVLDVLDASLSLSLFS